MIEITNVGPVKHLKFEVPETGGLVVFRGRNGSGKSTTLEAIQAAVSGGTSLSVTDGELKGSVKAYGVTVTVSQSTRRRGEAEVTTLEGPGDVSTLVDPGIADPESADSRRVKALLSLTRAKIEPSEFWPLLGGSAPFAAVVDSASVKGDDPIAMAERIKRDIERAARAVEEDEQKCRTRGEQLKAATTGVDVTAESDAEKLNLEWEHWTQFLAQTRADAKAYQDALWRRSEAAARAVELRRSAVSIEDVDHDLAIAEEAAQSAEKDLAAAIAETAEKLSKMIAAEKKERELSEKNKLAQANLEAIQRQKKLVEQTELTIAEFEKIAKRELPAEVNGDSIARAEVRQAKARIAVEQGVAIRKAKSDAESARMQLEEASRKKAIADKYRAAAAGVDGVLSLAVGKACARLQVEDKRLILETSRGKTYYADLSHGKRWRIALDVAIAAVGKGGALICPQEAFESLDPINRNAIAEQLRGTGVVMFTAEASDDTEVTPETI